MLKKDSQPKTADSFTDRSYRQLVKSGLVHSRVKVQESDLDIYADRDMTTTATDAVITCRGHIEGYIRRHPDFLTACAPLPDDPLAPAVVREMIRAGKQAGVGPMAAVAGAVANFVGRVLLTTADEAIVENGGDVFLSTRRQTTVALFAGNSPLSLKVGLELPARGAPHAVCTSSGTVGHSISYGNADAVCVLSASCSLADAVATAVGNRIRTPIDIQPAIDWAKAINGVEALVVVLGEKLGAWGGLRLVPLSCGHGRGIRKRLSFKT